MDRLAVVEEPDPSPGPGEVLVAVAAAAVSFVDGLVVRGRYQVRPPLPHTPGSAVAGRVAAVAPLPDGVAAPVAAAAVESYSTLAFALEHRVRVRPGEWVLVLGAGGGIGLAAVDVCRAAGARVVAAASTEAERTAARAAGAQVAVGYDALKDRVREVTGGGADVVVDPVGGPPAEPALRSLTAYGRYCVLGFAAGEIPRLPANLVLLRNRGVVGVDWGDWARTRPEDAVALLTGVLGRVARGELRPPEPTGLPPERAAEALTPLAHREVVGKLVLVP